MTKEDRLAWERMVVLCLVLACSAGPALAHEPTPAPAASSGGGRSARPADPISLIEGDVVSWSVSKTDAGCYLMSPRRKGASRLAIGRHPVLGQGLFAIGLSLSTADPNGQEQVGIETTPVALMKPGRMVAAGVLFVLLDGAEMKSGVNELKESGVLWIRIRNTGIAHRGKGLETAIGGYAACADTSSPEAPEKNHE